jgi:hypothetical protein
MVDVAALDVATAKASGGGDMWVSASGTKTEVATADEFTIRDPEKQADWDGVQGAYHAGTGD